MQAIRQIPGGPVPVAPYSTAVKSGNLLFCSGQIGSLDGELVAGGVEAEAKQVMKNLDVVLNSQGLTASDIVMTTIFLSDMKNYALVNELYGQWVSKDAPPARQTVGVKELPRNASVEISVIAELR